MMAAILKVQHMQESLQRFKMEPHVRKVYNIHYL